MFTTKKSKRLITVLLSILIAVGLISWIPRNTYAMAQDDLNYEESENIIDDWTYDDCEIVIDYINTNLDDFVSEYNKIVQDGNYLNATSIEYSSIIYLIEDDNYGIYIDFNEDNGYIVGTGSYNIYELKVDGDLDYLREESFICYSYLDGFVYVDENNAYQRYEEVETNYNCFEQQDSVSSDDDTIYAGQEEAGDGKIDPLFISDYIEERYHSYTYESSSHNNLSKTYPYSNQYYTSYYRKQYTDEKGTPKKPDEYWSEGNCVLNAVYSLIKDWYNWGYITNIPTSLNDDLSTRITSDPLYPEFGTGILRSGNTNDKSTGSGGSTDAEYYKWTPHLPYWLNKIPTLYSEVRDYAVNVNGYTPETGYSTSNVPSTIEHVTNTLHGNSISISSTTAISNVLPLIDNNTACYLAINNSTTYGNHGVVIVGYQKYSRKIGVGIFAIKLYLYFYELADSWNTSSRYFDPNTSAKPSLTACYMGEIL